MNNSAERSSKILLDVPRFPEKPLGMHVYMEYVLANILASAPSDLNFTIHSMGWKGLHDQAERLSKIDKLNRAEKKLTRFPESIHERLMPNVDLSSLTRGAADIIHSFGTRPILSGTTPMIVTVQDVIPLRLNEGGADFVEHVRKLLTLLTKQARAVITISEFSKREIAELLNLDQQRIHVIPNGVDRERFRPVEQDQLDQRREVLQRFAITKPYIVHLGGAAERKNVSGLLKGFAHLRKTTDLKPQLILGGQKLSSTLLDLIQSLGISESVKGVGYLDQNDALSLLQMADVLAFPSIYEGFGLPPLEAMACGVPIAIADAASLPEVGGESAAYFDPLDPASIAAALNRVLSDHSYRSELISSGLKRSETYSWQKNASDTIELYRKILEESSH